jgi:hypothetical protein
MTNTLLGTDTRLSIFTMLRRRGFIENEASVVRNHRELVDPQVINFPFVTTVFTLFVFILISAKDHSLTASIVFDAA